MMQIMLIVAAALVAAGCASHGVVRTEAPGAGRYAIAIHGGAGVIDKDAPAEKRRAYEESLKQALAIGRDELAKGGTAMDACEKVVRFLEDDPKFNAGKGAVYNAEGKHELDASVMDGATLGCGAVASVRTVKNPISLARLVMEKSGHVMLIGDGAEQFSDSLGGAAVERVPNTYFDTPERYEALQKKLEERKAKESPRAAGGGGAANKSRSTVGCVCLDTKGNLAAATSTGGLTAKRYGRVGDSPIIGAGTYANNKSCAVSCTGTGEEFIRHTVARDIAALMEYKGMSAKAAAEELVFRKLQPDDGGVIVVSKTGEIAMVFSSDGMFRGAADSGGRFEVAIWE